MPGEETGRIQRTPSQPPYTGLIYALCKIDLVVKKVQLNNTYVIMNGHWLVNLSHSRA